MYKMLQKRFAIQAIKNTIEIGKLFLKKGNFAEKPAAREVEIVELKHSLKTAASAKSKQRHELGRGSKTQYILTQQQRDEEL